MLVLLGPDDREWSLSELATRTGTSLATVQREVDRAERSGVVSTRKQGNMRLVRSTASPLVPPLSELLLRSFGPRQVVSEELAELGGIEAAYIFGSWAARYNGEQGHAPADVDVLVVGAPDRDDLDEAAQRACERLAQEVNVTIRSGRWWSEGDDGFHQEITKRPLVRLTPADGVDRLASSE